MPRRSSLPRRLILALLIPIATAPASNAGAQTAADKITKTGDKAVEQATKATSRLKGLVDRAKGALAKPDTAKPRSAPAASPAATPTAASSNMPGRGATISRGSAKIDEQVVAPNEQGMAYYITPRGSHLGAVVPKGSRFAVSYDGVTGPAFDRILQAGNGSTQSHSPDGSRYGYVGETDGKIVYMVDGKDVLRIAAAPQAAVRLKFSPNGKHWWAHFINNASTSAADVPRSWWDGVPGPLGAANDVVMSPDGERHAYRAQQPGSSREVLVVDGKVAPTLGGNPVFSADGKHLFTTRDASPQQGLPITELLLDGRPVARAQNVSVHVPPVGDRYVAVLGRGTGNVAAAYALMVGGQLVSGSESSGYSRITFSPDGRRYAAVSGSAGSRQRVFADGKSGRVFDAIDSLWFSPDSKHLVYTARAATKVFVITDDIESDVGFAAHEVLVPRFTSDGRVGWMASTGQQNVVVVDGKVTPLNPRVGSFDFSFSPDGKRFAYVAGGDVTGQRGGTVHVDHVPGPPSTLRDFEQLRNGDPVRYVWSPDGRYTVNYGYPGTNYGTDFGFIVGHRYIPVGNVTRVGLPTFTPDAKHLFWLGYRGATSMRQVWLDGRVVYEFDERGIEPLKVPGGWTMGDDGTLTFFVQTVEGFKRVRIVPGPDNGFEAWLAKGRALK